MNEEEIKSLYQSGLTGREVAFKLGLSKTSVLLVVKNLGISRSKRIRDCVLKKRAKTCNVFKTEFSEYLDGLLLSDGCIPVPLGVSEASFYSQYSISHEWLMDIACQFELNGIQTVVSKAHRKNRQDNGWILRSHRYDKFFDVRNRWYPNGIKVVPRDIDLTSKPLLKQWIYGDGTLLKKSTLRFCTDSFALVDIDYLVVSLNKLGFRFKRMDFGLDKFGNKKYRIAICKRDGLVDFFNYVGGCDINYFIYKWV